MVNFGQKTEISPNYTKMLKLSKESKTLLNLKCLELILFRSVAKCVIGREAWILEDEVLIRFAGFPEKVGSALFATLVTELGLIRQSALGPHF